MKLDALEPCKSEEQNGIKIKYKYMVYKLNMVKIM